MMLRRKPKETVFMTRRELKTLLAWLGESAEKLSVSERRADRSKAFEITRTITRIRLYNDI